MTAVREKKAIASKQIALRDQLWPGIEEQIWQRKSNRGFTTIPKTFPMIMQIMNEMTKDTPVGSTYLSLWCSTWDNSFASLSKAKDLAYASGFSGQRAEYVWGTRMRLLERLEFISIKAGKSGPMSHALIWNPHFVIRRHYRKKTPGLSEASYTALIEWGLEIGAVDISGPIPETADEMLVSLLGKTPAAAATS